MPSINYATHILKIIKACCVLLYINTFGKSIAKYKGAIAKGAIAKGTIAKGAIALSEQSLAQLLSNIKGGGSEGLLRWRRQPPIVAYV